VLVHEALADDAEDVLGAFGVVQADGGQALFFSDTEDLGLLEFESEKLGTLSDMIDVLQPEDIIDICCRMQKGSKSQG